eukprot:g3959.t1
MFSGVNSGFIFGCTDQTEGECRQRKLFGLPGKHSAVVQSLPRNTPLFLFNYDRRVLYGMFWSTSRGGWNLVPGAWNGQFPAQIQVRGIESVMKHGELLTEDQFRPILAHNYFDPKRFQYDLTKEQVSRLKQLLIENGWNQHPTSNAETHKIHTPALHRMNRPIQMKKRGKKIPVLKLVPGKTLPMVSRSKRRHRYFAGVRGFNVLVDERFPVTHHAAPREHRSTVVHGQISDDQMDVEMTPIGPPSQLSPVSGNELSPPLQMITQHERRNSPVQVVRDLDPLLLTHRQSSGGQQWTLGEFNWNNAQSFRKFLTERNPPDDEEESPTPVPHSVSVQWVTTGPETGLVDESVSVHETQPSRNEQMTRSQENEVIEIASTSEDEIQSLSTLDGVQNDDQTERKLCLLQNDLASNFGIIGCDVTACSGNLPPEQRVPGTNLDHVGVVISSRVSDRSNQ